MVWADMHNAHASLNSKMKVSRWSHSYMSGEEDFTSSILLILFNCTIVISHVSCEIGRSRF